MRDDCARAASRRLPRAFCARALTLDEAVGCCPAGDPSAAQLGRAQLDLSRFFRAANQPVLDAYMSLVRRAESEVLIALARDACDAPVLQGAAWFQLAAEVLQTEFLTLADPEIHGSAGLRKPLYPFLCWADSRLAGRIGEEFLPASLRRMLLEVLSAQLFTASYKALVLELSVLSLRHPGMTAGETGSSPEMWFAHHTISSPRQVQRLFLRYAALTRLLATMTLQWLDATTELLQRLHQDRPEIDTAFPEAAGHGLTGVEGTGGDPHDHGRQVLVLSFESGVRLVYKPRPMQIDVAFQGLLYWLNEQGLNPPLRPLRVVARDGYGWVEFVETAALPNEQAAHRFYERQGALLAALFVLKGTDFHHENVIASGEDPVLVDLETLLHTSPRPQPDDAPSPAQEALRDSIFSTGLLPGWSDGDALNPGPDVSGIGAGDSQFYRNKGDQIAADPLLGLKVVRERLPVAAKLNRPSLGGAAVDPARFALAVADGFEQCYRLMEQSKTDMLASTGPLEAFRGLSVRHVAMATSVYASLLRRSTHPDFLCRTLHRELLFAILASRTRHHPAVSPLVVPEAEALLRGDIPKFSASVSGIALSADGRSEIADYLRESGEAVMRTRAATLSAQDREFQTGLIDLGMATLRKRGHESPSAAPRSYAMPSQSFTQDEVKDEVRRIARRILKSAIRRNRRLDWIGLTQGDSDRCRLSAVGNDLYDGVAGIGLFLSQAGQLLQDDELLESGKSCAQTVADALAAEREFIGGGFMGKASMAYATLHQAALHGNPDWKALAVTQLKRFADEVSEDRFFDVIAGAAGLGAVQIFAYETTKEPGLLAAAIRSAEHLLAHKIEQPRGFGWPCRNVTAPLCGFSHGAAGIGWALCHIGSIAGREDLIRVGQGAFSYERSVFSREQKGWPDFREGHDSTALHYPFAWCHGGPGIGLSRAALPPRLFGETELRELQTVFASLRNATTADNDCLCHGEIGNVETLVLAGSLLQDLGLITLAQERVSAVIRRARASGDWRCGIAPDAPTPGLLTGIAGIGYGLLRTFFPDCTPSVLRLS